MSGVKSPCFIPLKASTIFFFPRKSGRRKYFVKGSLPDKKKSYGFCYTENKSLVFTEEMNENYLSRVMERSYMLGLGFAKIVVEALPLTVS